jgi:hypothetical protein
MPKAFPRFMSKIPHLISLGETNAGFVPTADFCGRTESVEVFSRLERPTE